MFFSSLSFPKVEGYPELTWSSRPVACYPVVILSLVIRIPSNNLLPVDQYPSVTIFYLLPNAFLTIFYLSFD